MGEDAYLTNYYYFSRSLLHKKRATETKFENGEGAVRLCFNPKKGGGQPDFQLAGYIGVCAWSYFIPQFGVRPK